MKILRFAVLMLGLAQIVPTAIGQSLNASILAAQAKPSSFAVVTLTTGSTVLATNTSTKYTTATFYGYSATSATAAPTANGANTAIGFTTQNADGTHSGTNLVDTVTAGSWLSIKAPPGTKYDLTDVCFNGTTGDKIFIVYEQ